MTQIAVVLFMTCLVFVAACDGMWFDWKGAIMKILVAVVAYIVIGQAIYGRCGTAPGGGYYQGDVVLVRVVGIAAFFAAFYHLWLGLGIIILAVCCWKKR